MTVMVIEVYVTMHIIIYVLLRIVVILIIRTGSWVAVVVIIRRPVFRVCGTTAEDSASNYDGTHYLKKLARPMGHFDSEHFHKGSSCLIAEYH